MHLVSRTDRGCCKRGNKALSLFVRTPSASVSPIDVANLQHPIVDDALQLALYGNIGAEMTGHPQQEVCARRRGPRYYAYFRLDALGIQRHPSTLSLAQKPR